MLINRLDKNRYPTINLNIEAASTRFCTGFCPFNSRVCPAAVAISCSPLGISSVSVKAGGRGEISIDVNGTFKSSEQSPHHSHLPLGHLRGIIQRMK